MERSRRSLGSIDVLAGADVRGCRCVARHADAIVERLRAAVASTATPAVEGAFGAFAGLFAIDERRLLAASTDSVGSKLVLGRRGERLRWCGADLAAHCINDVLTTGAEPLFFLDYVAANTIDVEQVAELIEGAADVCRAAGCAILGGETAELPGIYRENEIDFCGTAVGVVDRDRVVDGSGIREDDLVARIRRRPASMRTGSRSCAGSWVRRRSTPTCSYRRPGSTSTTSARSALAQTCARSRMSRAEESSGTSRACCRAGWARSSIRPPGSVPRSSTGSPTNGVAEEELRRVFNIGIGYCAVIPPGDARDGDLVIGHVVAGGGVIWT